MERRNGWFSSIGLAYGDRVSIDNPDSYANAGVRDDVARLLGNYGMLLSDAAPVTAGSLPGGTVRIVVSRSVASVPGCPAWRDTQAAVLNGGTSSNYGFGVQSKLAAMLANPQALVQGQPGERKRD